MLHLHQFSHLVDEAQKFYWGSPPQSFPVGSSAQCCMLVFHSAGSLWSVWRCSCFWFWGFCFLFSLVLLDSDTSLKWRPLCFRAVFVASLPAPVGRLRYFCFLGSHLNRCPKTDVLLWIPVHWAPVWLLVPPFLWYNLLHLEALDCCLNSWCHCNLKANISIWKILNNLTKCQNNLCLCYYDRNRSFFPLLQCLVSWLYIVRELSLC